MKKFVFSACLLICLIGLIGSTVVAAPDLYEHYNTGDDMYTSGPTGNWRYAQMFTAESNHDVTSVKLKLWRGGTPGNLNVSIKATSSGIPTGADLSSGILDMNSVVGVYPGGWYEIPLSPTISLTNGLTYAIVIGAPDAVSGLPHIYMDSSSPEYTDGYYATSPNAGATWYTYTDKDFLFEIHGPGSTVIDVDIDIKPCSEPNSINLRNKGVLPVAILTTQDFDATTVDWETVMLDGVVPAIKAVEMDVCEAGGPDGDTDLIVYFSVPSLSSLWNECTIEATLTGETDIGTPIEGTDSVRIVTKGTN